MGEESKNKRGNKKWSIDCKWHTSSTLKNIEGARLYSKQVVIKWQSRKHIKHQLWMLLKYLKVLFYLSPYVSNDSWQLWALFKAQTGHTKTDGHDTPQFKFNNTFTLHPQEMITTESHLINVRLCEWPERPWGSIQVYLWPHTHEHVWTCMNTQSKSQLKQYFTEPLDTL